jgi:hypothetical protein
VVRRRYELQQPEVHAAYRESFSRVDVFNKLALGPSSIQDSYQTRSWSFKFFLCCVAMAETNAYLAYKWRQRNSEETPMAHKAWREKLAW